MEQQMVQAPEVQEPVKEEPKAEKLAKPLSSLSVEDRYELVCRQDFEKAKRLNWEEPEFDFRQQYKKGDKIFYARILLDEKEVEELTIRTVYPRMIVGVHKKGTALCIGYPQKERIFDTQARAAEYCRNCKIQAKPSDGVEELIDLIENELEGRELDNASDNVQGDE